MSRFLLDLPLHLCTLLNPLHPPIPRTAVVSSLYLYLLTSWTLLRYLVVVDHFGYCLSVFDPKGATQVTMNAEV